MVEIALIAALDRNFAIGRDNALPWHLPADLKRFKALTTDGVMLMGRKTAESLGRALPNRLNLVMTRAAHAPFAGMETVASVEDAIARTREAGHDTLQVIGGGEIYALTLPMATRMHLTWVDTRIDDAHAHFPRFDADDWQETFSEAHAADERHAYAFRFADYARTRAG